VRCTHFGFELQVLGTNPRAAEPAGIRSNAMILKAMLLSGRSPAWPGCRTCWPSTTA
jgi:ABC-type uncharacterized transport system permease subunit